MPWKDDARRGSLSQFAHAQPPAVADSDLIVMAINRLQRAVAKMQSRQYDAEMHEHIEKASDMLAWVAKNVWLRGGEDPAEPAQEPMTRDELHAELQGFMDSLDDSVTADMAAQAYRKIADAIERRGIAEPGPEFAPGECEGHGCCTAKVHIHGCFADLDGKCNAPAEHPQEGVEQ